MVSHLTSLISFLILTRKLALIRKSQNKIGYVTIVGIYKNLFLALFHTNI